MSGLPHHIGYIVDGNRRWAAERGWSASRGHTAGYKVLKSMLFETIEAGVPYVSAYVFSTENWSRSKQEVDWLMNLLVRVLKHDLHEIIERGIRVRVLGSREELSQVVQTAIEHAEAATKDLRKGQALLCINYGGKQEIADALTKIMQQKKEVERVTPELIEQCLYTPDVPPCDIIVRTSGEQRLSNFMLWRSAYSELIFLDKPWPEMTKSDITGILQTYEQRNRRFGG